MASHRLSQPPHQTKAMSRLAIRAARAAALIAAFMVAQPSLPAQANGNADFRGCSDEKNPTLVYAACTQAISTPGIGVQKLSTAYFNRAIVMAGYGKVREAIMDLTRAIELDLDHHKALNERGRLYRDQGDLELAMDDFSRAIDLAPDTSAYFSNRGLAEKLRGNFSAALADYNEALHIDPTNDGALHRRGALHREMKNFPDALADLQRALAIDRDNASIMVEIGLLYADQGRHTKAIAYFDDAIARRQRYAEAWLRRGLSYAALDIHDLAVRDLQMAEELGLSGTELKAVLAEQRRLTTKKRRSHLAIPHALQP